MSQFDRLSSLINRFSLSVIPVQGDNANLLIFENKQNAIPSRILLSPQQVTVDTPEKDEKLIFSAFTEWGGRDNPLFATLPDNIELHIQQGDQMELLVQLLKVEAEADRCGSGSVLNRLGEVLIIRLLRYQIEQGSTAPGLLGGLADKRLSRAIVSMHEKPGNHWNNNDLAQIAGLSISRFSELFHQHVGETPQAYLRRWRMILARQDIQRGDRIQSVASRYGYGSSEALGRAFTRQFGNNPISLRRNAVK